jgi:hypothetical protein
VHVEPLVGLSSQPAKLLNSTRKADKSLKSLLMKSWKKSEEIGVSNKIFEIVLKYAMKNFSLYV